MQKLFTYFALVLLLSCNQQKQEPVALPSNSIFHLQSNWYTQDNEKIQLKDLKGKTLVVVMIYTSCKSACPRLVANMKTIAQQIPEKQLAKTSLVLITIDPETDRPKQLKEFARVNEMEEKHWTFLTGDVEGTQELANVLAMKYKKISPIDFSHSNIISIFSADGQMKFQEEGLDIDTKKIAEMVRSVAKNNS